MEYIFIMDTKNEKILKLLRENSKLTTQHISKKTSIPITTVHNRIKKLVEQGIIKKYTIEVDHEKLGKNVAAYIHIIVDYTLLKQKKISQHELAKRLKLLESVEEVAMVTGEKDIILKVREKNIASLDMFVTKHLRNIEGIEKTHTSVILHEF